MSIVTITVPPGQGTENVLRILSGWQRTVARVVKNVVRPEHKSVDPKEEGRTQPNNNHNVKIAR